jgi:hypothetical protein
VAQDHPEQPDKAIAGVQALGMAQGAVVAQEQSVALVALVLAVQAETDFKQV